MLIGIVSLRLDIINIFHVVLTKSITINFFVQKPCRSQLDLKYQPEMLCLYLSLLLTMLSNSTRVHQLSQGEALSAPRQAPEI